MNIITYLRVSTDGQDHEPQRLELKAWIERNGFTAIEEFSDIISGSRAERPGLDALMERCRVGGVDLTKVDAVAVVKLDRLGRSVINVVTLIAELEKMGVAVICTSQGIDTRAANPCGKMQYQIIAAVAEFEREIIRERTRAGLAVARRNGKVLGRPSRAMVGVDRKAAVDAWLASGRTGGLRALAAALGGCSPSTASKVLAEVGV